MKKQGRSGKALFVKSIKINPFRKMKDRIFYFLGYFGPGNSLRVFANRMRGVKIGKKVFIDSMVHIDTVVPKMVEIGDNVKISIGAKIFAHNSIFQDVDGKNPIIVAPVKIGKNSQIAPNAVILEGVTIGESSIIGASAVVSKDIPSGYIAVGIPAKPVKKCKDVAENLFGKSH